jgi:hypothetical protein
MYQTYLCRHDCRSFQIRSYVDIKVNLQQGMLQQKFEGYELREDGILMYRHRFYVSNDKELKILILSEMHKVPYVGHPSYRRQLS